MSEHNCKHGVDVANCYSCEVDALKERLAAAERERDDLYREVVTAKAERDEQRTRADAAEVIADQERRVSDLRESERDEAREQLTLLKTDMGLDVFLRRTDETARRIVGEMKAARDRAVARAAMLQTNGRWTVLTATSHSGKTLFSCKVCGRVTSTPDRDCRTLGDPDETWHCSKWQPVTDAGAALAAVLADAVKEDGPLHCRGNKPALCHTPLCKCEGCDLRAKLVKAMGREGT